jgi:hypothetical protein
MVRMDLADMEDIVNYIVSLKICSLCQISALILVFHIPYPISLIF